jgi:hypothetical protein
MRLLRFLLFGFAVMCLGRSYAASDTITLKVTVYDSYTKANLTGVSIINPVSSITLSTNERGTCTFRVPKNDTLFLFFPSYRTTKFSVSDSAYKSEYVLRLPMEPLTAGLNQSVVIKAPKTLEDIEEERKKLGETPKELIRPELSFTSPVSALYELLSKRAHEREKLKGQIEANEREKVFTELLNYYNEQGLIDLPQEYYPSFISYCNLPTDFLKYNSDYDISNTIVSLYNKYGRMNGLIK